MRLCIIPPTDGLFLTQSFKYQMCLAHMILDDNPTYANVHHELSQNYQKKVIVDNSLWELGEAMNADDLIKACERIGRPYELILPDDLKNSKNTILATETFINDTKGEKAWERNFVVPHGSDREDWLRCYDYFLNQTYAETIGPPKVLDDIWSPGGRVGCCLFLEQTGRIDPTKQYHCLGIRTDPIEALMLSSFKWIRSLDTALPIHAGLKDVRFDPVFGLSRRRTRRPEDYFGLNAVFIGKHLDAIRYNIDLLDKWCRGVDTSHAPDYIVEVPDVFDQD